MRRRYRFRDNTPSWTRWVVALVVLDLVLAIPDMLSDEPWKAFLHLPVELPVFLVVPVLLPPVFARAAQRLLALLLALLTLVKIANIGVFAGFDRPFDPFLDPALVTTALGTLARANVALAIGAVIGALLIVGFFAGGLLWAGRTLATRAELSPGGSLGVAGVLILAGFGFLFVRTGDPPITLSGADTTLLARAQIRTARADLRDRTAFAQVLQQDPLAKLPATTLLSGVKGVDVLVVFIESYGQTALTTPEYANVIRPTLGDFDAALKSVGFSARSAWAKSPTFGGESWLAHSTLLSGLWIDNQRRYRRLMEAPRSSLISDFKRAGWRTVGVMPEITLTPWSDAAYFGYDTFYGAPELHYAGASFGYMSMPDQFTLAAFQRDELAKPDHAPVMAQIALVSSHIPWAPIPKLVPWDQVGDGAVFTAARTGESPEAVWRTPSRIPGFYAQSVDYVLRSLMSFVTAYGRDNMLIIVLGDHQPISFISGDDATHAVPIHIIARDPALLAKLGDQWTSGMIPDSDSPVWPMDTIRAHIHATFTPGAAEVP